MKTFQLPNLNEHLEPEELESWESKDFEDMLQGIMQSEQETELSWNDSLGWR